MYIIIITISDILISLYDFITWSCVVKIHHMNVNKIVRASDYLLFNFNISLYQPNSHPAKRVLNFYLPLKPTYIHYNKQCIIYEIKRNLTTFTGWTLHCVVEYSIHYNVVL